MTKIMKICKFCHFILDEFYDEKEMNYIEPKMSRFKIMTGKRARISAERPPILRNRYRCITK